MNRANAISQQVTGIILSGGGGTRFQHMDKGWIDWHGKPLIEHCVDSLKNQVARIIISCNRNHDKYAALGYDLCPDKRPLFQGPLAGIEAGLDACKTPFALIFPCDSAAAPDDLVETLTRALIEQDAEIAYLNRHQIPQYLIAVVRTNLKDAVSKHLDNGGRAVRHWYKEHKAIAVDAQYPERDIVNFNTPEALK